MNARSVAGTIRPLFYGSASCFLVVVAAAAQQSSETEERIRIAAANMEDAIVIDCQLPGKLRKLGGTRTYLTPGRVIRTSAIECRTRGGEYTLGDLASGTLSLKRWLGPAQDGDPEAQYYVARIYANGMDNVDVDYAQAAVWYQKAADGGFREAKQELGYLYEQGLGVEKDELRALNLQREASGLGEQLDYAWKVAEAEAAQEQLAQQLEAANASLQQSRLDMQDMQERLAAARMEVRDREAAIAALYAELADAREAGGGAGDPDRIAELQWSLQDALVQLEDTQGRIVVLERERDDARAELQAGLIGGQAASLELQELLAASRQETDTLRAQLATEEQRLIQSEEELRALRETYREETEALRAENERLLAARTHAKSDVAAQVAAREAQIASRKARVESLQAELAGLREQLAGASGDSAELAREMERQQARYDAELARLQSERSALEESYRRGQADLSVAVAASQQQLAMKEAALESRRRQIESLEAESERLQARVAYLESQQAEQETGAQSERQQMRAQLDSLRKEVIGLRNSLQSVQSERSALQAQVSKQRLELQNQVAQDQTENQRRIELLEAEIAAGESKIKAQTIRIAALEEEVGKRDGELAALRSGAVEEEPVTGAVRDAMEVLEMARSDLGEYHALLIANEKYQHLPSLTTPIRDVTAIKELLESRYDFKVEMLTNATDDQIMKALHNYSNELDEADNLLIYYAGRGSTPDGPPDRAYWLGVDSDPDLPNTWLLAEHVSEKIKGMSAKRVLVVTDSCFSKRRTSAMTLVVGPRGLKPERFRLMAPLSARLVLTSGANVPVPDETGDRTHSLFSKYFIEVLRQNSNVLSGEMLSHQMIARVQSAIENPERATPTYQSLHGAGHNNGEFFFVPSMEANLVASAGAP